MAGTSSEVKGVVINGGHPMPAGVTVRRQPEGAVSNRISMSGGEVNPNQLNRRT